MFKLKRQFRFSIGFGTVLLSLGLLVGDPAYGLQPDEVLVIANGKLSASVELAQYYMERRGIPKANLLKVWVTERESFSRKDFERNVLDPVRKFLTDHPGETKIRCLLTVFGVPLKIWAPELPLEQRRQLKDLQVEKKQIEGQLKISSSWSESEIAEAKGRLTALQAEIKTLDNRNEAAALDSELALVLAGEYPLAGWVLNPFFMGFGTHQKELLFNKGQVVFTARLDGPSEEIVKRVIDDSLAVEERGLQGKAYFDASAKLPTKKTLNASEFYNKSLHLAADKLKRHGDMTVILDDRQDLFQQGDCPDAALYCGWYSHGKYIDAFQWQKGSVGYHIASSEAVTLRNDNPGLSKLWCKNMLENGAAATIGPVMEPYLTAFPVPDLFFPLLIDGSYTLVEAYFLSLPYLSWQMVLVGDPLYRPYGVKKKATKDKKGD